MKNIVKIFFIVVLALSFTSCEDFLVREPLLDDSYENTLSNWDGLNKATVGCYGPLYSEDWYGAGLPILADLKADNAKSSPISSGRYQNDYNWLQDPSNTSALWTRAYVAITRACNVINALDELDYTTLVADATPEQLDHLKAEALFIRALGHFDLLRMYAQPYTHDPNSLGVPIILETPSPMDKPARNTVSEVYDQIITDLTDAIPLFTDDGIDRGEIDPKGFASANAAKALLARVYLYMGDYPAVYSQTEDLIDTTDTGLYTAAEYTTVWGEDAAKEIIFEVWGNDQQSYAPYWEEIGYMYDPTGYGDVCATSGLLALYEAGDVRANLFQGDSNYPGYFWPTKYPGKGSPNRSNNIPVLRMSDVVLMRAEAALAIGKPGEAQKLLHAVRSRRGLTSTPAATEQDIFDERRRELCFEGHLLFDYARLNKNLDRNDEDNRITGFEDISFPSYLWAMPIPIQEIEANENIVQNPEY